MDRRHVCQILAVAATIHTAVAVEAPTNLVSCPGDKSIVLHWDPVGDPPFRATTSIARSPAAARSSCRMPVADHARLLRSHVSDGQTYLYQVTAWTRPRRRLSFRHLSVGPNLFTNNDANSWITSSRPISITFGMRRIQPTASSRTGARPARLAASQPLGFGLTAIGIAIDHGWITRYPRRGAGPDNVENLSPMGRKAPAASGLIGYNGWYYHFLDMNTALRSPGIRSCLRSTRTVVGGNLVRQAVFQWTQCR